MEFKEFSQKQMQALSWWCEGSPYKTCSAVICDGAVRSGKTLCMGLSFLAWATCCFEDKNFALCGRTIRSLKRNLVDVITPLISEFGFKVGMHLSENFMELFCSGRKNRFYFFGGKDESSSALIQGITLAGVLFDEVALMPRSFVEQALARCSVEGSTFWFNCNPQNPQHWFYQEWILKARQKSALYLHFQMEDNPSLSASMRERYRSLYSGSFYERFVLGKWVAAQGLVYPFMTTERFVEIPKTDFERYVISCDYGTVNPSSFGLWGLAGGIWYRLEEYYFDSRQEGVQRTDEEHYAGLETLAGGKTIGRVIVDPSAASFMEVIRRHGRFSVIAAKNEVLDGIRFTGIALKQGDIRICRTCTDCMREFSIYRWNDSLERDSPVKENDHAMDDLRYFVSTELERNGESFCVIAAPRAG